MPGHHHCHACFFNRRRTCALYTTAVMLSPAVARNHAAECYNIRWEAYAVHLACLSVPQCTQMMLQAFKHLHHTQQSLAVSKHHQQCLMCLLQLLKNLRHSIATLDILGEWGTGARSEDEAALELKTDRIWMEGRAQQKHLSALQVCPS